MDAPRMTKPSPIAFFRHARNALASSVFGLKTPKMTELLDLSGPIPSYRVTEARQMRAVDKPKVGGERARKQRARRRHHTHKQRRASAASTMTILAQRRGGGGEGGGGPVTR